MGTNLYLGVFMRIIATNTLKEFWSQYPECEQSLKAWLKEIETANWNSPQELKTQFKSASILTGKRIVFNINGNRFRLLVDIEFRLQIVFIVWFGSHANYDLINSKTITYVKTNKDR